MKRTYISNIINIGTHFLSLRAYFAIIHMSFNLLFYNRSDPFIYQFNGI